MSFRAIWRDLMIYRLVSPLRFVFVWPVLLTYVVRVEWHRWRMRRADARMRASAAWGGVPSTTRATKGRIIHGSPGSGNWLAGGE